MVASLEVDTVVVAVKICLPLELLRARLAADHCCAWVRVLAFRVVGLHVRFPVVASLEEFAADSAFVGSFFRRGPLALLLDAVDTWQGGRAGIEL